MIIINNNAKMAYAGIFAMPPSGSTTRAVAMSVPIPLFVAELAVKTSDMMQVLRAKPNV